MHISTSNIYCQDIYILTDKDKLHEFVLSRDESNNYWIAKKSLNPEYQEKKMGFSMNPRVMESPYDALYDNALAAYKALIRKFQSENTEKIIEINNSCNAGLLTYAEQKSVLITLNL